MRIVAPALSVGMQFGQGIPVIGVRTDFRLSGDTKGFNVMLYFSAARLIDGDDNVLEAIISELKVLEMQNIINLLTLIFLY